MHGSAVTTLEGEELRTFNLDGFSGVLMEPDHADYDRARELFNGMIDRRPALIARCASASDVVQAVNLARDRGLSLSVYGGGHGVTGSAICEGGVVVDLRGMKSVVVNPAAKTVRAEGGVTWGEFDAATQAHGLLITGGRNPTTGIGGLTLGSGSGWLERKFGLVCDHLIRAELVTADGRLVVASDDENPDLFWALRGGGGNFGVVTAFHYRLNELGPLLMAGVLFYPKEKAREAARFYRNFMEAAPDEVCGAMSFTTLPSAPFVPEEYRGQPGLVVITAYAGPLQDAGPALAPLRSFGPPIVDLVQPMAYTALQAMTETGFPPGARYYWSADAFSGLPDEALDLLASHATRQVSPFTSIIVMPGGGAVAHVDDDVTAFGQRRAPWNIHYLSGWLDSGEDAKNIAYTTAISAAMKPWTTGGVYLNYIGEEGQARIEASFGPKKLARLQAIKAEWDPNNLFRHNQNIRPAA
jgi:FAD/FMN-containing dehydrogenase